MGRSKKQTASARRKIVFRPAWDDTNRDHRQEFRLSRSELVRYALHTHLMRGCVYVTQMIGVSNLGSSLLQLFVIPFELN